MAAFLVLAAVFACDQRDPQAEYEALRDAVFSDPRDGMDIAEEYINHFRSRKGSRGTEVSEIYDYYRSMHDFFSGSYRTYPEFMSESRPLDVSLSYCNYEGVRNTWNNLYGQERSRLLAPLMDRITELTFDGYFKNQVRSLCQEEFKTWDYESIDRLSLSTPTIVRDGSVKEASGQYRVHLRGNIIGIRTSTATVAISGLIGVDADGNLVSERTGYDFLDSPIL